MTFSDQPEGPVPEYGRGRQEVIQKLEATGVPLKDAMEAIMGEMASFLRAREADLVHSSPHVGEQEEEIAIEKVREFGVDPFDLKQIQATANAIDSVRGALVKDYREK